MARKDKRIKVSLAGSKFISKTTPGSLTVKFKDDMNWRIDEKDKMPMDATVELRFSNGSIVGGNNVLSDKGKRTIQSPISAAAPASYTYKVWYVLKKDEYVMEDPELVMEGGLGPVKKKGAKKKAAKKR